ncbi:MAG: hypothetical protein CO135_03120 [Candidatus Levybacteria bacterium CG_4_9_14_3_um_filter_35_16]|nr:MAG: hypothetical protein COW87_01455 [Candidatus Levybacteria bacterium CG22_combo_CG10-13_8_21_14_all_35_11]PIY94615.1 MAG: hypothetical protein COY68_01920 [Candidatus Levybacteria bacterium CG_4_10_14_0_8_um_filter_35_23]PJA91064.1 MAG: hypothetical protein CO135_03120 [Candidatus Levybacteria bacterium CG_4_9_14_3_um_filter_35_16]PJC54266.1 MAG: hypothetical protein CO028_03345 [Candidatus Levybacteria bacterium CG_4_9_14_0_2_um_filter_35_21]
MASFLFLIFSFLHLIIQPQIVDVSQGKIIKDIQPEINYNIKPTSLPTSIRSAKITKVVAEEKFQENQSITNLNKDNNDPWGVSKQISEHTWTIKIGEDAQMATPQEIYEALNNYRRVQGKNTLGWNSSLSEYAQSRADFFSKENKLDEHAGFNEYFNNSENIKKTGFYRIGENSSIGYRMSGVHLIEWVFASDVPHNDNQLNSAWNSVGVGVSGTGLDLIFGGN